MRIEHRFLRTQAGNTRFARVRLSSEPSPGWIVTFAEPMSDSTRRWRQAIEEALRVAIAWHARRSDARLHVCFEDLIETYVDTSIDAIECAVIVAACMSFGWDESCATTYFAADRWNVRLS